MTGVGVARAPDVSRETRRSLEIYAELLKKWSPRINLVAAASLAEIETRHFEDSLQVSALAPSSVEVWADLGSGGGFPGLVVAIARRDLRPVLQMHLVESDQRKAAFLRTVSRETDTPVIIHTARAERLPPLGADVVSARALASLPDLLPMVQCHLRPGGVALLPKGRSYERDVMKAREDWQFSHDAIPSKTDANAAILRIGDLRHV